MTAAPALRDTARDRAAREALLPGALRAARRGDERAFMLLYHWRACAVWTCVRLAMPEHLARPTVRAVFRRVWQALPECTAQDAVEFDEWLIEQMAEIVIARRPKDAAPLAMWDLPAALRETVLMRDVFGHGLEQVARAFETPVETARLWYRSALESVAAER